MRQLKFSFPLAIAVFALLFTSCNSGKDKKTDENKTDSTGATTAQNPPATPSGPQMVMIVRHKVADYAKWKSGYDAHDSARLASGLHSYVIGRGVEDSNTVLIAMKMDDADKARAFASNPGLKDVMTKAGVIGAPVIDFIQAEMNDTTAIQQTIRCMVRHKVKDYDAWKKVYDGDKQNRMDAGITDRALAYTVGDNHAITLVFAVADLAKAKAFGSSKGLADKMKEAGVDGPPDMFYYRVVQKY